MQRSMESKANLVEGESSKFKTKSHSRSNKQKATCNGSKDRDPKKTKENCWVCEIPKHRANNCRHKKGSNGEKGNNKKPNQVNIMESNEIAMVVMETCVVTDSKGWWIDIGATRHICGERNLFSTYENVGNGERPYMGNNAIAKR